MPDINQMKSFFKDASDAEAKKGYEWATTAMEVRGLIEVPGARKRRSDAGMLRAAKAHLESAQNAATIESVRERINQPPLALGESE